MSMECSGVYYFVDSKPQVLRHEHYKASEVGIAIAIEYK